MTIRTSWLSPVVAGLALLTSSPALAIDCEEVIGMLEAGVPGNIVAQAVETSGASYTADDVRCMAEKGAPDDVLAAARKLSSAAEPDKPSKDEEEDEDDPFATAEGIGSDVDRATEKKGALDAVQNDPRVIQQLIELYRAKKYLTASKGLFDLLEEDTFPEQEAKLHYYLAKSLNDMGLYHSAQHYMMQVVRKGPRNPYFKYALPKLVALAEFTGNDVELLRIVHKIPPDAFPRKAKNHLFYLMGRKLYEEEDMAKAVKYFQQVSPKSELFLRSKYYEGVIQYERNRYKSAVLAFRDVFQTDTGIVGLSERDIRSLEDLKDLSLLNIARIFYELERFDNAMEAYDQVNRRSIYWTDSVFERAWTEFMREQMNNTLGLLLTIKAPYYRETYYNPEVDILRALTFFKFCEYEDAEALLLDFEARYSPMREELKGFLKEYDNKNGRRIADQAFEKYFENDHDESKLAMALLRRTLRNRDIAMIVDHLDLMDEEVTNIDKQKSVWRDTIGAHLKKVIEKDRRRYKRYGGRALIDEIALQNKKLGDWLSQSQIIRFEIVDAQRADYEFALSNPNVDVDAKRAVDFAESRDIVFWPFNGEFWQDELGYYEYTEQGSCK